MTPERALLGRTVERLKEQTSQNLWLAGAYYDGRKDAAEIQLTWLTAEMAKLPPDGST